jgi:hypothetical protein
MKRLPLVEMASERFFVARVVFPAQSPGGNNILHPSISQRFDFHSHPPFRRLDSRLDRQDSNSAPEYDDPGADLRARLKPGRRKRSLARRAALAAAALVLTFLVVAGLGLALLHARLAQGPIDVVDYLPRIDAALEERFGHGYDFGLTGATVVDGGYGPELDVQGLSLKSAAGRLIFVAPSARVAVNPFDLVFGRISVRKLDVFDLELRLVVMPDGALAMIAGADPDAVIPLSRALAGGEEPSSTPPPSDPNPAIAPKPADGPEEGAPPAPTPRGAVLKQAGDGLRTLVQFITGPDSPLAAVERVGVSRARLVIDDRVARQTWMFDAMDLSVRKDAAGAHIDLSAKGPNGRWRVSALATGAPGESQTLQITLDGLSRDEIAIVSGAREPGFDFDMPVSARFDLALKPSGLVETAGGRFGFGAGYLRLDDPDHEPLLIDSISGGFAWDAAARRIRIEKTDFVAGDTRFSFAGGIDPPADGGGAWRIEGQLLDKAVYGLERRGDAPIELTRGKLIALATPSEKKIRIETFEVGGPEADLRIDGDVTWFDGPRVKLGIATGPMPSRAVVRLWPAFVAPAVRDWLFTHLRGGTFDKSRIDLDLDALALRAMRADKALPTDAALAIDFTINDAQLEFLASVPPLRGLTASGRVTGHSTTLAIARAYVETRSGARLNMVNGQFTVPDTRKKPAPAGLDTRIGGNIDAVADLLNTPALKPYATIPLDPATIKGEIGGRFGLDMLLGKGAGPDSTHMNIVANVSNFTAQKLIGKEALENANLTVAVDPSGVSAAGQGRVFGAPAMIEMRKPAERVGEASISLTLDDALRAKHGFGSIPGLSGPVGVKLTSPLGGKDKPKAQVEMDLTRAGIDGVVPGFSKPAGRAGKLSFSVTPGDGPMTLGDLLFDGGGATARGVVELGADGAFREAKFSQVKLSPSDDMRVDVNRTGAGLKVVVRGANIDARPFIKSLLAEGDGASGGAGAREVQLDVKSPIVTGFNRQIASNVDLDLVQRGGSLRSARLSGRFGRDALNVVTEGQAVRVTTADAGSLLSFLDIYKRMEGGVMSLTMQTGDKRIDGELAIRDFVLRDEPALRRLVTEAPPQEGARVKINPTLVEFQRMSTTFSRVGGRIDLRDATIYSPSIGTTAEGWVDFGRDRLDLNGTFVPAYGLNNLLARIPVVGVIIGGGSNEGIFGVNYRLTGSVSSPTLNVNPLSAIAPGIFRKIFGAGQALPPQTIPTQPTPRGAPRSSAPPTQIIPRAQPREAPGEAFSPER